MLDSATWRASKDWGDKLGYGAVALDVVNRDAVALLFELRPCGGQLERAPRRKR